MDNNQGRRMIFVTRWFFTEGIVYLIGIDRGHGIMELECPAWQGRVSKKLGHWHDTREEAVAQVRKMCAKRIAGLKRQIEKVEEMDLHELRKLTALRTQRRDQ